MKLDTNTCLEAFKIVDMVDMQPGMLSSQFVRLTADKKLRLSLTGVCIGEAVVKLPEPEAWKFYIDRRVLGAFLASTKAKQISLEHHNGELRLVAGRQQKVLVSNSEDVSGYTSWSRKESNATLKLSETLRKELKLLAEYAPTTAAADHLSAVNMVKGYGTIGTDSFIIAAYLDPSTAISFPLPVVLTKTLASKQVDELLLNKGGAGVQFSNGYLYQTVVARARTNYPLKKIQGVLNDAQKLKPLLSVDPGKLHEGLTKVKAFVFGSSVDIEVTIEAGKTEDSLQLSLNLVNGSAQVNIAGKYTGSSPLVFPIDKIAPWIEHIASLKDAKTIYGSMGEGYTSLRSSKGNKHHILVCAGKGK